MEQNSDNMAHATPDDGCAGGCPGCGGSTGTARDEEAGLSGWMLAAAAVLAFLLPLALAVVGAILMEPEILGGLIGLTAGVLLAVAVSRMMRRGDSPSTPSTKPGCPAEMENE